MSQTDAKELPSIGIVQSGPRKQSRSLLIAAHSYEDGRYFASVVPLPHFKYPVAGCNSTKSQTISLRCRLSAPTLSDTHKAELTRPTPGSRGGPFLSCDAFAIEFPSSTSIRRMILRTKRFNASDAQLLARCLCRYSISRSGWAGPWQVRHDRNHIPEKRRCAKRGILWRPSVAK
jgi:hypothetical protein